MDEALVCAMILRDLEKVLGVKSQTNSKAETITRHDLKSMLTRKAVILGYIRPKKDKSRRNNKRAKGLNAQQNRAVKIFQIKPDHQRYELFLPLNERWRRYIIDLYSGLKPKSNPQFVQQKAPEGRLP